PADRPCSLAPTGVQTTRDRVGAASYSQSFVAARSVEECGCASCTDIESMATLGSDYTSMLQGLASTQRGCQEKGRAESLPWGLSALQRDLPSPVSSRETSRCWRA